MKDKMDISHFANNVRKSSDCATECSVNNLYLVKIDFELTSFNAYIEKNPLEQV